MLTAGGSFDVRRADFLALISLAGRSFDVMAHRGAVPFTVDRGDTRSWRDYSGAEVLQMDLTLALANLGRDQLSAASLVRDGFESLRAIATKRPTHDLLFGYIKVGDPTETDPTHDWQQSIPFATTVGDFRKDLAARTAVKSEKPLDVCTTNVTARVQRLEARAKLRPNHAQLAAELSRALAESRVA